MSSFAERVTVLTQKSMVGMASTLAWKVGIFQALADAKSPLTSAQVAQARQLNERYTRDLLGCLSTAELVQVSQREDGQLVYSLEDGAKALEARIGAVVGFPSILASLLQPTKECVSAEGAYGFQYSDDVQEFFDILLSAQAPQMVSDFLANVPDLKSRLDQGLEVLEVGAGGARLSAMLATKFPKSRFVASEVCPKLVDSNRARWAHVPNLSFSVDDLCALPDTPDRQYDWVFCNDVIHDLPDPPAAFRGIRRFLRKPDGVFSFVDVAMSGSPLKDKGNMRASFYYACGTFLCVPESYQRSDSMALGPCWGRDTALNMATQAGFDATAVMLDAAHGLFICRLPRESET